MAVNPLQGYIYNSDGTLVPRPPQIPQEFAGTLQDWQHQQNVQKAEQSAVNNEAASRGRLANRNQAFYDSLDDAFATLNRRGVAQSRNDPVFVDVANRLTRTYQGIPEADENPRQYFTSDIVDDAIGRYTNDLRTNYTTQARNAFSPGREDTALTLNMDDPFISSVLGQQKGDAMSYLDRAKSRGLLDDTGYGRAVGRVGEMERIGFSEADKIGNAIIQGGRTNLRDIGNEAVSTAGSWNLGQNFSLDPYQRRWNESLENFNTNLEGSVRSGLEGQSFFDLSDLIAKGNLAQGATNPALEGSDAIAQRMLQRNARRGVGSSGGVF